MLIISATNASVAQTVLLPPPCAYSTLKTNVDNKNQMREQRPVSTPVINTTLKYLSSHAWRVIPPEALANCPPNKDEIDKYANSIQIKVATIIARNLITVRVVLFKKI